MDYQSVFSSIPMPATLIDMQGRIVDVNDAFLEWARGMGHDLRKQDRIGHQITDFSGVFEEQRQLVVFINDLLEGKGAQHLRWEGRVEDGHLIWGDIRGQVVSDGDGNLVGAVILREDVTEEVLQERRQLLLHRLRDEILRMRDAHDTQQVMVAVQDGLRSLGIPMDDCGVNLVDDSVDPPVVQFHSMTAEGTWRPTGHGEGSKIIPHIWRQGEIAYRRDLMAEDEHGEAPQIEGLFQRSVRSVIDVPFAHGTLAVNSPRPNAFSETDLDILTEMAQALSEAFDRLSAIEALRQSEGRYRAMVSQIAEAVLLIDLETHCIVESNRASRELLGYDEGQIEGESVYDVVAHDKASIDANEARLLKERSTMVGERRFRHRDGHLIDVDVSLTLIEYGNRETSCVVARDIGDRKRRERRRQVMERLREEVWRMQTGREIETLIDLARTSLRSLGVAFDHFGMNLIDVRTRDHFRVYAQTLTNRVRMPRVRADQVLLQFWTGGEPVYRADLEQEDPYDECEIIQTNYGMRIRAVLDVPFSHGTVAVNSLRPHAFSDDDIALVSELATALSDAFRRTDDLARLAAQREHLMVTLRSIGDGVISTDADGCVELLNEAAEALTGWSQEEAQGEPLETIFRIVDATTRQPCSSPVQRVVKDGHLVAPGEDVLLLSRDGSERLLADSSAPMRDQEGVIIGAVLVFQDVTDQRKTEQDLAHAEKLESLGVLAGGIAHDFNNILTAITGHLSLAGLEASGSESLRHLVKQAEKAAMQAARLTQQLLTFSRGGEPVRQYVDMGELLEEAATFVLRGSNVSVDFDLPADLHGVHGDPGQLAQVVQNLVINADQAMEEGGKLWITAANSSPTGDDGYVRIDIRDVGRGMPAEVVQRIFEPYFTTKEKGSGLGLATAYAIIDQHGGHLSVDSVLGEGTTFTLQLPIMLQAVPEPRQAVAKVAAVGQGRVLVMDDEEEICILLERMLGHLGYRTAFAQSGDEAVQLFQEAIKSDPFDVVVLDLTVPGGMGGAQTLSALQELDPDVRAVVSSGYSNDPVMARFAEHGFRGVVRKPYVMDQMAQALAEALN
ncbi:MAG: PAS domain S-box protein [Gemmatimonadetes bacterium]|jgi:PAS domain S-box-containing protein|nr:PAS domain S-box protein [Gemmatimonadota bacterium]